MQLKNNNIRKRTCEYNKQIPINQQWNKYYKPQGNLTGYILNDLGLTNTN